jgi:hypothetical protein
MRADFTGSDLVEKTQCMLKRSLVNLLGEASFAHLVTHYRLRYRAGVD